MTTDAQIFSFFLYEFLLLLILMTPDTRKKECMRIEPVLLFDLRSVFFH